MARTRMVTRTINVTLVDAMCVDTTTAEVTVKTLELTGKNFTADKALKELKKQYETDTLKIVAVSTMVEREEMYGLSEIDFLKVASKLDPATRKIIDTQEEDDTEE